MQEESNYPRLFTLIRQQDQTGISGTGRVLDGVVFHTGQVVICWRSDLKDINPGYSSLTIFESYEAFQAIHIDPHPINNSKVLFFDDQNMN